MMKIKKILMTVFLCMVIFYPTVTQAVIPSSIIQKFNPKKIKLDSITIDAPDIAENGAVVTVKIKNILGIPKNVYVTKIILFNDFSKQAIASFKLAQNVSPFGITIRVKMKTSGSVYAIAKLSNGEVLSGEKYIQVTLGGCGGGGYSGLSYNSIYTNGNSKYQEKYAHITKNGVIATSQQAISTFSIDVDTASYSNVRRFLLKQNRLPTVDAVRVEEMINYFNYEYPKPKSDSRPFSINTEIGPNPWNSNTQLLHIGLKGYEVSKQDLPPANLVFLIDVSGSMASVDKLGLLTTSLKMLTRQLSAKDSISVVVYAGASGVVLAPTAGNEHTKIFNALDRLKAGGSTNGASGIKLAYAMAKQGFIRGGINRVILATDGDFNVGIVNHNDLIELIEKQRDYGVSLTTLGFGMGNYNDHLMEQLADKGNGNSAYIDSLMEAKKVLIEQRHSTLYTIAKDVKIQVQFNPDVVAEYRLIGYENRLLKQEDFSNDKVDAGDIGAGHTVTALYEITLKSSKVKRLDDFRYQKKQTKSNIYSNELAIVRLRYKIPKSNKSKLIEKVLSINDIVKNIDATSENYQFATAVAAFSQSLRGGEYTGSMSYQNIKGLAANALGADNHGYRHEFLNIIDMVLNLQALKNQS